MTPDERFDVRDAFAEEFARLVRKYVPVYPTTDDDMSLLYMLQDSTSCFSPYVWSAKFDPQEGA